MMSREVGCCSQTGLMAESGVAAQTAPAGRVAVAARAAANAWGEDIGWRLDISASASLRLDYRRQFNELTRVNQDVNSDVERRRRGRPFADGAVSDFGHLVWPIPIGSAQSINRQVFLNLQLHCHTQQNEVMRVRWSAPRLSLIHI